MDGVYSNINITYPAQQNLTANSMIISELNSTLYYVSPAEIFTNITNMTTTLYY
jgi:hypothetical protein